MKSKITIFTNFLYMNNYHVVKDLANHCTWFSFTSFSQLQGRFVNYFRGGYLYISKKKLKLKMERVIFYNLIGCKAEKCTNHFQSSCPTNTQKHLTRMKKYTSSKEQIIRAEVLKRGIINRLYRNFCCIYFNCSMT